MSPGKDNPVPMFESILQQWSLIRHTNADPQQSVSFRNPLHTTTRCGWHQDLPKAKSPHTALHEPTNQMVKVSGWRLAWVATCHSSPYCHGRYLLPLSILGTTGICHKPPQTTTTSHLHVTHPKDRAGLIRFQTAHR